MKQILCINMDWKWMVGSIAPDTKLVAKSFKDICFCHVRRRLSGLAHDLAKLEGLEHLFWSSNWCI